MKKLLYFFILIISLSSCSHKFHRYKKPSRRELKEYMKWSDWRYSTPNNVIQRSIYYEKVSKEDNK